MKEMSNLLLRIPEKKFTSMKEPPLDSTLSHFRPLHIFNTYLPDDLYYF